MTNQILTLRRAICLVLAVSGAVGGTHAIAADAVADTSNAPALEEIIVTAQKRSENLQDVPISVVAINAQQAQDAGITNIRNLAILTPGLTVTSEGNEAITTARIRGIGTVGDNPGLESSVGVNIDGVYRPRNGVAFGDLGEIDQIEVLYGPQGELFGKNNDAGVINVTTKKPENTFGAMAEVTGGNFNDREVRASVTGPLNDIMAGRLYMGFQQNDGFLQVNNGVGPSTQNNTNDRHSFHHTERHCGCLDYRRLCEARGILLQRCGRISGTIPGPGERIFFDARFGRQNRRAWRLTADWSARRGSPAPQLCRV